MPDESTIIDSLNLLLYDLLYNLNRLEVTIVVIWLYVNKIEFN